MGRAPCCDKDNVKRGPWSPEEDDKLKTFIDKYGYRGNWIALPQKIGLKRCGKSCRLRWLNYLRPNIKHGGFSEEEDNIICNLYMSIGSRWSIIAAQLPGRTDNDIKNYWNTKLKKKLLGKRKQANEAKGADNDNQIFPHGLTNSALERLQLHFQLQSLRNPLSSFYNNHALWPKNNINPLQEKLQSLQASNGNPNNLLMQPHLQRDPDHDFYALHAATPHQDYPKISNAKGFDQLDNSLDGISPSDCSTPLGIGHNLMDSKTLPLGSGFNNHGFKAELQDEFLNDETSAFYAPDGGQMAKLGGFNEMNGTSKDSVIWWSGAFDAEYSAPSNCWGTSTSVLQFNEMFQDYEL